MTEITITSSKRNKFIDGPRSRKVTVNVLG